MTGPSLDDLATPARLLVAQETLTPQGGRLRSWQQVNVIWVVLMLETGRELTEPGLPPRRRDQATAIARDNPAIIRGVQLAIDPDPPWRVRSVRRRDPGRGFLTMSLEREV